MNYKDFCTTCGGLGKAAFGNPATKIVSRYDICPSCNGIGWNPDAIVRDGLDAKALREAVEFIRGKNELERVQTENEHKHLANFQKYLDYLKSTGKWDADLIKTWDTVSRTREEYES